MILLRHRPSIVAIKAGMSIRKLVVGLFLASSVLTLIATVALAVFASRMDRQSSEISDALERVRASEEIQVDLFNYSRTSVLAGAKGIAMPATEERKHEDSIHEWIRVVRSFSGTSEDSALIDQVDKAIGRYIEVRGQIASRRLPIGEAARIVSPLLESAYQSAETLTEFNAQRAREQRVRIEAENDAAKMLALLVGILGVVCVAAMWILIKTRVYLPILGLIKQIDAFTGATAHSPVTEEGPEEIRTIASAFNRLSERIVDQRRARLKFLASVAHDIRNPLSAIRMSGEALKEEFAPTDERRSLSEIITRQAGYLDRMVGDLLDSSRIEAGQLELAKRSASLSELIEDCVGLHRQLSQLHRFRLELPERPVICQFDPLRISQVMNNLVSNAIKYSPEGGTIRVILRVAAGESLIQVTDDGIGIAEGDLQQIFEPFRRTALTKQTIPGIGLGLSVTKRIVEAHGGTISVESSPGQGSKFSVRLPSCELVATATTRAHEAIESASLLDH